MNTEVYDVLILGGGPAGLSAAIYTSRANLKTLVVAGFPSGGQLMLTSEVENFPGFPEGILGPELIETFKKQSVRFGAQLVEENVTEISGDANAGFTIKTHVGNSYTGKAVIVATGASARWLDLESVHRLRGKGVTACATCDGFFFKGKAVAVVGGGDSAVEEALFLTKFATKVYMLVRSDHLRASKIMQDRARANDKIEILFNTEVLEVLGEEKVEGLKITNKTLPDVEGLFMAIGHTPNTQFLEGFLDLREDGYVQPTDSTKTSVEGVFVAGDVSDWRYRQAVTAAGVGCMAALDVEKFLAEKEVSH